MVVSGCCVSAHDMAATWAMNSLGAPALWLSLMSSAGTLPFFLFTLPAGAMADLADRRRLLRISNCWLAGSAGLLAICSFLGGLTPEIILAGVFLLGTGFAFQAPVASASIPEIVGKEQLPSAIALGGIQMNLAGIIGPALGGLLVPLVGVSTVFAVNAFAFTLVLFAVMTWKRKREILDTPLEGFFDSLAAANSIHAVCPRRSNRSTAKFHLRCFNWSDPSVVASGWPEGASPRPVRPWFRIHLYGTWIARRRHFRPRASQEEVQTESDDHAERYCSSR